MKIVEVKLWGTTIGHLGYAPGQRRIATFEYDERFIRSGIAVSPIVMPCPPAIHTFDAISERSFKGLPGICADSLPDTFGNQLIDLYLAERKIPPETITSLDRLLYVGTRGMGALEYHPAHELAQTDAHTNLLDIHQLSELAAMVQRHRTQKNRALSHATLSKALGLIRVGSSAGGARSKALIAKAPDGTLRDGTVSHENGYSYWLLKFDSAHNADRDGTDPKGMTRVEYLYSALARLCHIQIPNTEYILDGNDFHFLIERFDRISTHTGIGKLHYASWAGLAHAGRDTTGAYSYEQLAMLIRQLHLGQDTILELYRRAIFNIVGRNQDDHTKNFGFLMEKTGVWNLSPTFDATYAFDPTGTWTSMHQIRMNGKQDEFTRSDLIQFAAYCNIGAKKANELIDTTIDAFSHFQERAKELDIDRILSRTIYKNLRLHL